MAEQHSGKLPIPRLPKPPLPKNNRKTYRPTAQQKASYAETKNIKNKSRIYIGAAFDRWKAIKDAKSLKSDAGVAFLLLDREEANFPDIPSVEVEVPCEPAVAPEHRFEISDDDDDDDGSDCPPEGAPHVSDIRWAASPQNHDPANQTCHGRPQLPTKHAPDLLAPHDVCVNIACLLRLFRRCGQCRGQCVVRKQGGKRLFTVVQHCQVCSQLTTWTSQPFKAEEQSVDPCEVTEGKQELTASLVIRKWFDSNTDTASSGGEGPSTNEGVKNVIPAEPAEARAWAESAAPPCEVRAGGRETAASAVMRSTMGGQTDGGSSRGSGRSTGLLTEEEAQGNAQERGSQSDPQAEVEQLTADSDFSNGSQRSREDSDGGEQEEEEEEKEEDGGVEKKDINEEEDSDGGEEGEEKEEDKDRGVEKKDIKVEEEEAEDTEESETQEEEDEWEMDDEEEEEEWAEEMDGVRKARKRLRDDSDGPQFMRSNRKYMINRKYMMNKAQKRPETLCADCGRLYRTLTHRCAPKKKFQCPDCGVLSLTELSFSVHRSGHCRSRSLPCVFCLKPFGTRSERLAHEMSHTGEEPYECPECPRRFWDWSTRSRHLKEHPKSFRCQTCQKDFADLFVLHRHELSHSANKPFKCEVCERMFAQASQLKSHLRVHTGEKPFQCQLCPKSFNHNVSLKNHVTRYHQGESHARPGSRGGATAARTTQRTAPSRRRSKRKMAGLRN